MAKEDRNRILTLKGKEFKMELLEKEIKRLKRKLSDQINLFEHLLKSKNVEVVNRELEKADKILIDLKSTIERYIDINGEENAPTMSTEEESLLKIKKAFSDWTEALCAKDEETRSGCSDMLSRKSTVLKASTELYKREVGKNEESGKSNIQIVIDLTRMQVKLQSQIELFEELFNSKDESMIKRELLRLMKMFEEMRSIPEEHRKTLSIEEKVNTVMGPAPANPEHRNPSRLCMTYLILMQLE